MISENDRAAVDRPTRLSITSFKNDPGDDDDDVDYDHHNMMMTMMVSKTFQAKKDGGEGAQMAPKKMQQRCAIQENWC